MISKNAWPIFLNPLDIVENTHYFICHEKICVHNFDIHDLSFFELCNKFRK